jgi:hypothetical protein
MKKEITLQEWEKIGKKVKEINKNLFELFDLLKKFPKTTVNNKWKSAETSFGKLRRHLDNIVCSKFLDKPNQEITHIFYGEDKKK